MFVRKVRIKFGAMALTVAMGSSLVASSSVCINCIAPNLAKRGVRDSKSYKNLKKVVGASDKVIDKGSFIPLDDNEDDIPKIKIQSRVAGIDRSNGILDDSGKIYACESGSKLVCDSVEKTCECV